MQYQAAYNNLLLSPLLYNQQLTRHTLQYVTTLS